MKKPARLGMGLSALMGDAPVAADSPGASPRNLPITALEPGPFQPRVEPDRAALAELAASITEHGILQPILVRPKPGDKGKYQIIGGERRWRAAQIAKLHDVPVVVREFNDRMAMAAGLVENLQREDLNAVEEAEGFSRLIEQFGLNQEGLARAVGKSRSHVANTLRLLNLSQPIREHLRAGRLSAGHARALLGDFSSVWVLTRITSKPLSRTKRSMACGAPKWMNKSAACKTKDKPSAQLMPVVPRQWAPINRQRCARGLPILLPRRLLRSRGQCCPNCSRTAHAHPMRSSPWP